MKKVIKMPQKSFDRFMCEKYPIIFQDRNKPMSETCMCWGFDVGKGWQELLHNLCKKIDTLYKLTGIGVKADQVKEKYGSLRFYTSPSFKERIKQAKENLKVDDETANVIVEIIDNCVDIAEYQSDKTCAECGENYYEKIIIGGWVYDVCEKCFKKLYPDRIGALNDCKQRDKFAKFASDLSFDYWNKNKHVDKKLIDIMDNLFKEFKKQKEKK
jgi:hypothetical protein